MGQKDCWWFWVLERKLIVKIGKESGLREEQFFFFWVLLGFMYYLVLEKKNQNFFIKIMLTWKIVELSKKGQRLQIYIY